MISHVDIMIFLKLFASSIARYVWSEDMHLYNYFQVKDSEISYQCQSVKTEVTNYKLHRGVSVDTVL